MIKGLRVSLFEMVMSLSGALDLVSPSVVNHQEDVAYIACCIADELGLSPEETTNLTLAGLVHDCGSLSLNEKLESLKFDFDLKDPHKHAEIGYLFLHRFEPFAELATLVRFHHIAWDEGRGQEFEGKEVPVGSHVLHLADRVAVLIDRKRGILNQVGEISERIVEFSGKLFVPEMVDAFLNLAKKEFFWLNISTRASSSVLASTIGTATIKLDLEGLFSLTNLFSQLVDFRSRFTVAHSSGVAASAEALARLAKFSERECRLMRVAGHLHDLGKLAVPPEILEKPDKLTLEETNVIKSHAFHTYHILESIPDLDTINTWASFHHERLNGTGYPFHHRGEDLPLGSRIMAVADVFTAITEERPYRKGMSKDRALKTLQRMAENEALDGDIVSLLSLHYDEIDSLRFNAHREVSMDYQKVVQT